MDSIIPWDEWVPLIEPYYPEGKRGVSKGADRVGVSLWCIDDEATAEFMTLMYQKVRQEGKSYSRAYREVKAEFRRIEDFDHPYYWAAFVLYE